MVYIVDDVIKFEFYKLFLNNIVGLSDSEFVVL